MTRMFIRFGYQDEEALTRARVLYYTQVGHFALDVQETLPERFTHVPSYLLTFTGIEPLPSDYEALIALAETV